MAQNPFANLDLSEFPDEEPEQQQNPFVLSDMDLSDFPDDPAVIQEPEPTPTVINPSGLWEKFRTPLTDIGSRTARAINERIPDSEHPLAKFGEGTINFLGGAVDAATAPINAIPTLLTGGAGLAKGAIGEALRQGARIASIPTVISGGQNIAEGEGLLQKGLGALETVGGLFGMRGVKPKVAPTKEIVEEIPVLKSEIPEAAIEASDEKVLMRAATDPAYREEAARRLTILPKDLAGAKPRFNIRDSSFTPEFESDIDKALYILAQKNPSKRDADYLQFVMEATGIDDPDQIRNLAQMVRRKVGETARGAEQSGSLSISRIYEPTRQAPPKSAAMPDYSPTSEAAARKVLAEQGIPIAPNMSNRQIIDAARAVSGAEDVIQKAVDAAPEITRASAKTVKPKVKSIGNGEFIPEDFPDVVLDAQGRVKRTLSGNPVRLPDEVKRNLALEVLNLPRAVNASMDFSFPLRQGLGLIHTKGWWKAWGDMFKAGFGGDDAFKGVMADIRARPNFRPKTKLEGGKFRADEKGMKIYPSFAEEAGLALPDNLTVREHEYMSQLAERMPLGMGKVIKASNRAYTAFANKLRADTFDSLVENFTKAGMDPRQNLELAKQIATFVNTASGRGNLGALEKSAELLNAGFFSPRLIAARTQMMGKSVRAIFDPQIYNMSAPNVRREYLKSNLALATAWSTMAGLAAAAGADVNMDPTNSDFMKIKIGNTRLDPGAGFQQFIVLGNRIAQGQTTSSVTGKTKKFNEAKTLYDPTYGSTVGSFAANKLAPLPKFFVDLAYANQNRQFDLPDRAARLMTPIMVQDLMEILNEGNPAELATLIPETFGMSTQTYAPGDFNRRMLPPAIPELTFPRKTRR